MSLAADLQTATQALNQGEASRALQLLLPLSEGYPEIVDVWQLLALAHKGVGDLAASEAAFLKAIALKPQPHILTNLANLYRQMGAPDKALARYDEALNLQPDNLPAQINRGRALLDLSRTLEAEQAFAGVISRQPDHVNGRIGLAQTLQLQGRQEEALGLFQSVLADHPDNVAAQNGVGISLKVLGYSDDAVAVLSDAARRAPESVEVQSNLASALAQSGREEEAVAAYQRALAVDPDNPDLHAWYNGYLGVIEHPEYLESYREVLAQTPGRAELAVPFARKLLLNERGAEAEAVLDRALEAQEGDAALLRELSHIRREQGNFDGALDAAQRALAVAPDAPDVRQELANAHLAAAGDYDRAVALLEGLLRDFPDDQGVWALYATALRYAGREEYHRLADYDRLVNFRRVEPAEGFASREGFVAYLREVLLALHTTRRHPVEQSMVHGTQTLDDLFSRQHRAIGLLREALAEQLVLVLSELPEDPEHPVLRRNSGRPEFSDSWSVRLREQGFHKNHFHSQGWLSSAFYLVVPDAVNAGTGEGWIKFGEPGFRAREPLAAEYWVKPEEGALVVFPSYLWHGTEPLLTARERMTVGYDILPA